MDTEFDMNHDLERLVEDVDDLMEFDVVIMCNQDPDIRIVSLQFDSQVAELVHREGGDNGTMMQTIICNNSFESKGMCPYFRVFMIGYAKDCPINFKFQSFLHRIGMETINPRCQKVVVVGLAALHHLDSSISVPHCFTTTKIDLQDFPVVLPDQDLDMACLAVCAEKFVPEGHTLCDIAGMWIPLHLPWDVQWNILTYLQSPTAILVQDQMNQLCDRWDALLYRMFLQREPRIPAHIACFYNAATVRTTVANATKPFLVPVVKENTSATSTSENS